MMAHIVRHLPNANLPHTAGCCCLAYFSTISISICTKLARSILMTDCNIVTEPNFNNQFVNLEFCRRQAVICKFRPSKQQKLLLANRSIAMTSCSPTDARPRPIAHKSTTNSHMVTKIDRRVLHDTWYIA